MSVLLEASHEEHKVRSRVRAAATLDGALLSLLEFENLSDDESNDDYSFSKLEDCQLFVMSEGESSTEDETETEVRELNGEPKLIKKSRHRYAHNSGPD